MELQRYSFKNDELNVEINSYIDKDNKIWFRGRELALILGYENTQRAIGDHILEEDKKLIEIEKSQISTHAKSPKLRGTKMVCLDKSPKLRGTKMVCLDKRPKLRGTKMVCLDKRPEKTYKCFFINESGFYSLILSSKQPKAKGFKHWVTSKVLPSIRKRGYYKSSNVNHVIETENDRHCKVVSFIREKYPNALMIAGLGENQKTDAERIESWRKGYMAGQCDLMLMNPTRRYNSLCIEFKDPKGNNHLSEKQIEMKDKYIKNKCRYLVSRSVTDITYEIIKHMDESNRYLKYRSSRKTI